MPNASSTPASAADAAVLTVPALRRARSHRLAAYIALHASRRPAHPAMICDSAEITYATLHKHLCAVTQALRSCKLPAGRIAAISHHDPYIQLLLVFGCEALGIITGSFRPEEGQDATGLLSLADLVLAPAPPAALHKAFFPITESWLSAALAQPATYIAASPASLEDIEVIFRSSGTTGAPKCMALTRQAVQDRLAKQRHPKLGLGLTSNSRFLALMHFAVGSIYTAAANLLRLGGTILCMTDIASPPTPNPDRLLASLAPTHTTVMPRQLRAIVNGLPDPPPGAGPLLPNLRIQTIGGRLPDDLRHTALRRLAGRLTANYGTNEVGSIGTVDPDNTVHLFPDVMAETGAPAGEPGTLRLRTAGMVTAYLNDPAGTAAMFRAGWFHSGDIGILTPPRNLKLVGRNQDILNLGGKKVAAADLEAAILTHCPVTDIALIQHHDGTLIACAILAPNATTQSLNTALAPLISYPYRIQPLTQIPRTAEGKIKRPTLHATLFPSVGAVA